MGAKLSKIKLSNIPIDQKLHTIDTLQNSINLIIYNMFFYFGFIK